MRFSAVLALAGLLVGCQPKLTRPPQDNFTLQTRAAGIEPFMTALSRKFGTSAEGAEIELPSSDLGRMFELRGRGVTVVVISMADDRCNPNAPRQSTYEDGEYRIDLVYRTSSTAKRQAAKRLLLDAANEARQPLSLFKEC